ncbi:hypothetical protein PAUR_a3134 [Pseudoalteromonas aurantia 208]|uniref:Uncharacterized protein n=1 Tax=Pseudoalteromonas aurantia 208 TaxID=1314867 RepID=A0ABR9EE96_9GAMM|nr:hypothetical protein [Pseudoalteromonas aurantia 208]
MADLTYAYSSLGTEVALLPVGNKCLIVFAMCLIQFIAPIIPDSAKLQTIEVKTAKFYW